MRAVDIIMKKRGSLLNPNGKELNYDEISFLINSYVKGEIPDYQISSWLMAVYFNGMTFQETGYLTDVMLHSGSMIDLSDLKGPFVDKHSTGGVGDKISLPLAPIVAACGVKVPMMSGRALGHTGGTLDKLESINGYNVNLSQEKFCNILSKTGFAMIGQSKSVVPADRLLYALRDVTGTVESIPLITASILSKKVAEGSDALVFDVKFGSGAFMKTPESARLLADSLVKTAQTLNKKAAALITNMNTPLGYKTGNFLEIEETLDVLGYKSTTPITFPDDVHTLTIELGAKMLLLGGIVPNIEDGKNKCIEAISSGKALSLFLENIKLQGGNVDNLLASYGKKRSPYKREIYANQEGFISIDAYKAGLAGVTLGVGRNRTDESVCPDAGFILHQKDSNYVKKGDLLMEVYGKNEECFNTAIPVLESSITYSCNKPNTLPLILDEIV